MSTVIQLPIPARLCAAREAITVRANRLGATKAQRRRALKGFGNAIVPQVAAEVIGAFMDCRP